MGIVSKISDMFGLSAGETYHFECGDCGETFESSVPSPSLVTCPECGGEEVTSLEPAE